MDVKRCVECNFTLSGTLRCLDMLPHSRGQRDKVKAEINRLGLDTSHFTGRRASKFKTIEKLCPQCTKKFNTRNDKDEATYCSRSCSNKAVPRRAKEGKCAQCGKTISAKRAYCSEACMRLSTGRRSKDNYTDWLNSEAPASVACGKDGLLKLNAKRAFHRHAGGVCSVCGWSGVNKKTLKSVVQVDHINGNRYDNTVENLRLLCPCCHSLTSTYANINKTKLRDDTPKSYQNLEKQVEAWKACPAEVDSPTATCPKWLKFHLCNEANNVCTVCGWAGHNPTTGNLMLQIDHIDGNPHNWHPSNLRVLCPNCHSQTPTFGRHGRGRRGRYLTSK